MTDFNASDQDVSRAIRSWLHEDRHEDASRLAGAVLDRVDTTQRRRATWWPARRTPIMNKIVTIGLGAAAVVLLLAAGAQLLRFPGGAGFGNGRTPTIEPTPRTSAESLTFTSRIHDVSIDYPAEWQLRPATEPWTGGALDFDSRAADVIFDPVLGDARYIILASQSGRSSQLDHQSDQFALIEESGVCDAAGGFGGGSFTVDGARAWGQTCASGIDGAGPVEVVAVTTDTDRYLFVLVGSSDGSRIGGYDSFDALLDTVNLRRDEGG